MKSALLKAGVKAVFSQFVKNPLNGRNMCMTWVINIDENIIEINDNKDLKLFGQNLIDITLEIGQSVGKSEKYYLILEIVVSSLNPLFIHSFLLFSFDGKHL